MSRHRNVRKMSFGTREDLFDEDSSEDDYGQDEYMSEYVVQTEDQKANSNSNSSVVQQVYRLFVVVLFVCLYCLYVCCLA